MYWNVVKRDVNTNKFVDIVKSFKCYGIDDWNMKLRALCYCDRRNIFRRFFNKYYYTVEFDFE
jgi:hypothetical protein